MAQVNEQLIADVVRQVLNSVNGNGGSSPASGSSSGISAADYPLGVKRKDLLKSPRGIPFEELTLENVESGKVGFDDFRISPEVLKMQGEIASSAGRSQIALNLGRAGELTKLPDTRILEIYNSLRPHRSTKEELLAIADELQGKFSANVCADFVREAADVYQRRKLLKGDLVSTD
ncbi:MAG: diol dehydratase small subunit [Synergistaceae bacterium]|jgi:propanediol dehydratase small subunit|nr:diol dehydratase small subunit [Synergistaceae bacterium]